MPKKEWEDHFATLDQDQRNDPFEVFELFCDNDAIFGTRNRFFELFAAAMGSNLLDESDDPHAKANWMWFFRITLQLMEAAYLIEKMRSENRLTYIIQEESLQQRSDI